MTSMNWRLSDNFERLVLTNEKYWKSTAIYYLYAQKNKQEGYLWLYPEISEEHLSEIRDMKPDETSKWGSAPENWQSKTGKDHMFDTVKYAYFAKDFALNSFSRSRFRYGKAPSILRRFDKAARKEAAEHQKETKNSWFTL